MPCYLHIIKIESYQFIVINYYISTENNPWGREVENTYNFLLSLIYNCNVENIILCRDLNARIGDLSDTLNETDSISKRISLDSHKNQHGKSLINFLLELNMCILNGRLCPEQGDFTCKTGRGMSAVDYIIVSQSMYELCRSFNVVTCHSMVEQYNLQHLAGERSKVPGSQCPTFVC